MHVNQASLVELVHNFVVLCLLDEVKLLDVESRFFEVVEPEFVASRQIAQGSLVQTCALLEVVDRLCHNRIPPGSEVVHIRHSSRL